METIELGRVQRNLQAPERARFQRQARRLAWVGLGWHFIEFAIAIVAGIAASSIALIGFGIDSLIESVAGFAVSFYVLAAYVGFEAVRSLIGGHEAQTSWVGIGLAAFTATTMPLLALAKRRVGRRLGSSATVQEASQTQLCAYLSIALLIGLGANALVGWWWADPLAALAIAAIAIREGRESWRGDSCACC